MTKRWLISALLCLLLPAAGVFAASENVLDLARIQDQALSNGMRVIIKSEPYWRAVALGLVVRSGGRNDPAGKAGLAHLVEHLLFEPSLPGKSLSLSVEDLGGYVSAATGADSTQITLAVASQFAPDLMRQLSATAFKAQFTGEQVDAEKQLILHEMDNRFTSLGARLVAMGFDLAFTQHPYRFPVIGSRESVTSLTLEDAKQFYSTHYVPANVALIAVGDLDPTAFFALARQQFGTLPNLPATPESLPVEPPQTEPRIRLTDSDIANTVIEYAWHAPGIDDPASVCALDLIYTALERGETSLLTKTLENQHLALRSEASFLTEKYPGLFTITVITPPAQELAARKAILELIGRFRETQSSDEELQYLKKLLYADYAFDNQSYADQAGTLAFYEAISSYRFACNYLPLARAVSAAQLQETATKFLREDNYSLNVIRPRGTGGAETNV